MATNAPAALSSGSVSAQDDAAAGAVSRRGAADAMAQMPNAPAPVQATTVRHSGNDWQSRNDLRNALVSASSITNNGGKWDRHKGESAESLTYRAMLGTDQALRQAQPGMDQTAMRENAGIQREGMQQQGANTRSLGQIALEQQKINQAGESQGFANRAAAQSEQLRNVLLDPNATPEQRSVAQRNLAALSGKGDSWKAVALQGGTDAQGNKTESLLGAVNEHTGEMKRMEGQGAKTTQQFKQGEVYRDAAGNTRRWSGAAWEKV